MDASTTLAAAIIKQFPELDEDDLAFAPPPKHDMGDLSLRTFQAARKLSLTPPQFAERVKEEVTFGPEVVGVSLAGPYVNFRLDRGQFARAAVARILDEGGRYGSDGSGRGQRVVIEHTSINPNADAHVGRARCALIGDSVVRVLRFEEYEVDVHYYVNDMGLQIGLLVLVCQDLAHMSFNQMLEAYVEANRRAEHDEAFANRAYALLAKMEAGDEATRQRFRQVTDFALEGQLGVLSRIGVEFDEFVRESRFVSDPRLEELVDKLEEKDAVFTDEKGRLTVDLAKLGRPQEEGRYFCLRRSNGSSMYGYRDLAYTIYKETRGADTNLIVLGEDHKMYSEQLALILEAAGYSAPEAIYYSYILLKEGKMSTRRGQVVLLSAFLDEAVRRASERVEEQCEDLEPAERAAISEQVALAAVRFTILRVSPNKNVVFEWDAALSFTGDTGPYIQYSCARIASILRKAGELPAAPEAFPVESAAEWALVTQLARFPEVVRAAADARNIAAVANFALDTARLFTTFYHDCPVLNAGSPEQRDARLLLCAATRRTLENALGLLGLAAPERM